MIVNNEKSIILEKYNIVVSNISTDIIKISKSIQNNKLKIFIIPGNPGIAEYYIEFAKCMADEINIDSDIYIISYAGFSLKKNRHYALLEELQHKKDVILYLTGDEQNTEIIIIGHSIGGWITKEIQRSELNLKIKSIYILFPFLALNQNSRIQRILKFILMNDKIEILKNIIIFFISNIPGIFKNKILNSITLNMSEGAKETTGYYFDKDNYFIKSAIFLAITELMELNSEIDIDISRIYNFYFSAQDFWSPIEHYNIIKSKFNSSRVALYEQIPHDFCAYSDSSKNMAGELAMSINNLD